MMKNTPFEFPPGMLRLAAGTILFKSNEFYYVNLVCKHKIIPFSASQQTHTNAYIPLYDSNIILNCSHRLLESHESSAAVWQFHTCCYSSFAEPVACTEIQTRDIIPYHLKICYLFTELFCAPVTQ